MRLFVPRILRAFNFLWRSFCLWRSFLPDCTLAAAREPRSGSGGNIASDETGHDVGAGVVKRKRFGIALDETRVQTFRVGTSFRALHKVRERDPRW